MPKEIVNPTMGLERLGSLVSESESAKGPTSIQTRIADQRHQAQNTRVRPDRQLLSTTNRRPRIKKRKHPNQQKNDFWLAIRVNLNPDPWTDPPLVITQNLHNPCGWTWVHFSDSGFIWHASPLACHNHVTYVLNQSQACCSGNLKKSIEVSGNQVALSLRSLSGTLLCSHCWEHVVLTHCILTLAPSICCTFNYLTAVLAIS